MWRKTTASGLEKACRRTCGHPKAPSRPGGGGLPAHALIIRFRRAAHDRTKRQHNKRLLSILERSLLLYPRSSPCDTPPPKRGTGAQPPKTGVRARTAPSRAMPKHDGALPPTNLEAPHAAIPCENLEVTHGGAHAAYPLGAQLQSRSAPTNKKSGPSRIIARTRR